MENSQTSESDDGHGATQDFAYNPIVKKTLTNLDLM